MSWFQVDDALADHPKVEALGDRQATAMWLWLRQGVWCMRHLTDGHVPSSRLAREEPADIEALISVGLWERELAGIVFHDWSRYQRSRSKVEADRQAALDRMRDVRANKKRTFANGSGEQTANVRELFAESSPSHAVSESVSVSLSESTPTLPRARGARRVRGYESTTNWDDVDG